MTELHYFPEMNSIGFMLTTNELAVRLWLFRIFLFFLFEIDEKYIRNLKFENEIVRNVVIVFGKLGDEFQMLCFICENL